MCYAIIVPTVLLADAPAASQARPQLSDTTRAYAMVDAPVVALTHVKLIDGAGAPPAADQTIVIGNDRILAVGPAGAVKVPSGARVMELRGATVVPGFAGLHDHTHYTTVGRRAQLNVSAPRMYLGSGVT